jgi:hypothetical protein
MKRHLLILLILCQTGFAQQIKLQSVLFAWASKNDKNGIYRDWKRYNQDIFIDTQNKTINSENPKNGTISILKQNKTVLNKKGDKVIKFECKDIDGTNCIVYFITYLKPSSQGVIGQVVFNFSVSNSIFVHTVKYKKT